jgi:hypothetical protein
MCSLSEQPYGKPRDNAECPGVNVTFGLDCSEVHASTTDVNAAGVFGCFASRGHVRKVHASAADVHAAGIFGRVMGRSSPVDLGGGRLI